MVLVITDWRFDPAFEIEDVRTGEERKVLALVMQVRSEDGVLCNKPWNLLARKTMTDLRPFLENKANLPIKIDVLKHEGEKFPTYEFTVLERGVKASDLLPPSV